MVRAAIASLNLCLCTALLPGCAVAPGPTTIEIPPGSYAQAFDAAKKALREHEFELQRIDAREGILTAAPRSAAGFGTPWIPHGTTFGDGIEDLAHFQRRTVRFTFAPASSDPGERAADEASLQASSEDLREFEGAIHATAQVMIERVQRPGRRSTPASARLTSFAVHPDLVSEGLQPWYTTPFRRDPELERRLIASLSTKIPHIVPDMR